MKDVYYQNESDINIDFSVDFLFWLQRDREERKNRQYFQYIIL